MWPETTASISIIIYNVFFFSFLFWFCFSSSCSDLRVDNGVTVRRRNEIRFFVFGFVCFCFWSKSNEMNVMKYAQSVHEPASVHYSIETGELKHTMFIVIYFK